MTHILANNIIGQCEISTTMRERGKVFYLIYFEKLTDQEFLTTLK